MTQATAYGQNIKPLIKVWYPTVYVIFLVILSLNTSFAQTGPPNITYETPKVYPVKSPILPLTPANTGGPIAAVIRNTISNVAGSPTRLAGLVNLPGTGAQFDGPGGLAVDANGNLYIADRMNDAVRKIAIDGTVSTLATININRPWGIEVNPVSGDIYVSNYGNHQIMKISPAGVVTAFAGVAGEKGRTDGPGLTAKFNEPQDLIFDAAGNLYVADSGNRLIRKITPQGIVSTEAGSGNPGKANGLGAAASFNTPTGLSLDQNGNLIIADYSNNLIRKMTPGGLVSTLAGTSAPGFSDGPAMTSVLWNPSHMVKDYAGNIIFSDSRNDRIRMISAAGVLSTLSGNGIKGDDANGNSLTAEFNNPVGLAYDQFANLYIADEHNNKIKKLALGGYVISRLGAPMDFPDGLIFDPKTGIISGTPDEIWPETRYKVTGYNGFGESSFEFTIQVIPTAVYLAKLPSMTVCDPDLDPVAISALPVIYTSSNHAVAIILNGNKIHAIGKGTTTITATNSLGEKDTRDLEVFDFTPPLISLRADKMILCPGVSVNFTAKATGAGNNAQYEWFKNGVSFGNDADTYTAVNLLATDKISVRVTNKDYCYDVISLESAPVVFTPVAPEPDVTITISPSAPVCIGTVLKFTAVLSRPQMDTGPFPKWHVNGEDIGVMSPVFSSDKLQAGDVVKYVVPWHNACTPLQDVASNEITVEYRKAELCSIMPPTAFSPNGDGVNDSWNIDYLAGFPGCQVRIFNRFGLKLYESTGYTNPWDGKSNGVSLPSGTYYYVIALEKDMETVSGSITIIK
ncbi:T9SS type B sorting domain-containing protein [Pedobacter psychroterrae]|uniref:T9SS type B sorting domain-containing protein n=1 Tax=Pedobacter psychroterrae TaxID=2530453 RepID=A0A4R0NK34_9SPHI|nr:gliding motility-associated C-terminal domain-containing protein [Pedobacter psychroterrae]TCD00198.1 T9SS type B sorting domain-containing protein [Pedobacter psychroterrae]